MLIIKAVKAMRVNKIPAKINQAFKRFLLWLSSGSFALEFLKSKIMNIRMWGCLYSLKLEEVARSGQKRRRHPTSLAGSRDLYSLNLSPNSGHCYFRNLSLSSGHSCILVIWWWFDIMDKERRSVWWLFLLILYPFICIISIMLLSIHWSYLRGRDTKR